MDTPRVIFGLPHKRTDSVSSVICAEGDHVHCHSPCMISCHTGKPCHCSNIVDDDNSQLSLLFRKKIITSSPLREEKTDLMRPR